MLRRVLEAIALAIVSFFVVEWPLWRASTNHNGTLELVGLTFFTLLLRLRVNGQTVVTFKLSQETIDEMASAAHHQLKSVTHLKPLPITLDEEYTLSVTADNGLVLTRKNEDRTQVEYATQHQVLGRFLAELEEYSSTPEVVWEQAR